MRYKHFLFHCSGGQALEQVTNRGCGATIPCDVQELSESGDGLAE